MNSLSFFFLRKSSSVKNANKKVKSNLLNRVSYFRSPAHFIHVPGFLEASWVRSPCIIALFRTHIQAFYLMYCSSVCGECVVVFIWSKLSLCWKSRPGGTFKDYRGIVMAVSESSRHFRLELGPNLGGSEAFLYSKECFCGAGYAGRQ